VDSMAKRSENRRLALEYLMKIGDSIGGLIAMQGSNLSCHILRFAF
jgi:hypothetical protein